MKDMTESIADVVIGILAEQAGLSPADVSRDATLESLGLDSLGMVETIFSLEETFDISVPFNANAPDAMSDFGTVEQVIAAVDRLVDARTV